MGTIRRRLSLGRLSIWNCHEFIFILPYLFGYVSDYMQKWQVEEKVRGRKGDSINEAARVRYPIKYSHFSSHYPIRLMSNQFSINHIIYKFANRASSARCSRASVMISFIVSGDQVGHESSSQSMSIASVGREFIIGRLKWRISWPSSSTISQAAFFGKFPFSSTWSSVKAN